MDVLIWCILWAPRMLLSIGSNGRPRKLEKNPKNSSHSQRKCAWNRFLSLTASRRISHRENGLWIVALKLTKAREKLCSRPAHSPDGTEDGRRYILLPPSRPQSAKGGGAGPASCARDCDMKAVIYLSFDCFIFCEVSPQEVNGRAAYHLMRHCMNPFPCDDRWFIVVSARRIRGSNFFNSLASCEVNKDGKKKIKMFKVCENVA